MPIKITVADSGHVCYAETICDIMEQAAKVRGTGIAKRAPEYISQKITEGKAVIAVDTDENRFAGFCYIEDWSHGNYIANSGLIVAPEYRKRGVAKNIKEKIFKLSREKYPEAKIFGITTSLAVMKINSDLGYKPVTFSELTQEDAFWKGCQSCPNYDILNRTDKVHCLCTGMLYEPDEQEELDSKKDRWLAFKRFLKLQKVRIKRKTDHLFNLI